MLFPVQSHGNRTKLFFVGGAHQRSWLEGTYDDDLLQYLAALLPHTGYDQPIYSFRPLGLFRDEDPHVTVAEMASAYIKELLEFQKEGPYVVGGLCLGGLVAYEMARQLKAAGHQAGVLFLDTFRPTFPKQIFALCYHWLLKIRDVRDILMYVLKSRATKVVVGLFDWVRSEFDNVRYFAKHKKLSTIHRHTDMYQLNRLLSYRPKSFSGPVALVANEQFHKRNPTLGWSREETPNFDVRVVPGDQITRLTEHGEVTGQSIRGAIDELLDRLSSG